MSKKLNETELAQVAKKTLEDYPDYDAVFATTDGNVFLKENSARLHAGRGRVITFNRATVFPVAAEMPEYRMNAKDTIAFIATADKEAIEEFANDSRKTVQEAYEKRMSEPEDESTQLPPSGEDPNINQEKE